ncbi:SAM-dependent methyltransferase [Actinokineospora sp.]|uniref:SAM-dependent methyltransferase n=1 Tax=Actinokineospora sp. TaxID=1872133 RepID=UPI00403843ED
MRTDVDTGYALPTPDEVGDFYNQSNKLIAEFLGGSMHYGYWTGPDDLSDIEVAAERLTDIMTEKLDIKPGHRVLDLGCGPGKPAVQLARATGAQVVGISVSTEDVRLASARARAEGMAEQVRFSYADGTNLPFEPESFDAVLALESIVHIPDRVQVLDQIRRVLRPGGKLALTDFIELTPPADDDDQRGLAEMLAAWRAAPLVRTADYPGFVTAAGLVLDEATDITEYTKYTFAKTYAAMREHIQRNGDLPPYLAEIFAMGENVDWEQVVNGPQSEGVVLVVAHRPPSV